MIRKGKSLSSQRDNRGVGKTFSGKEIVLSTTLLAFGETSAGES
jgi:hypothetical protein